MSARSYLSIGDVLTLLRQEFQDITISKIRFLESQGLVNPERTPSGYRKFYEHDVERLRWVLRQQREHFLPLKVIKDRLDDEPGAAGAERKGTPSTARATSALGAEHDSGPADQPRTEDPVLVGHRVRADSEARSNPSSAHPAADGPLSLVGEGTSLPGGSALPGIGAGTDLADEPSVPVRTGAGSSPGASSLKSTRSAGSSRRGADRGPVLELLDDGTSSGPRTPPVDPANGSEEGPSAGTTGTASPGTAVSGSASARPGSPGPGSAEPSPEAPVAVGPKETGSGPEPDAAPRAASSPRTPKSRGKPGGRAPAGSAPSRAATRRVAVRGAAGPICRQKSWPRPPAWTWRW